MHYLVTIGYETEKFDRHGEPKGFKVEKHKCIVESESVEEATIVAAKYRSEDKRTSDLLSVSKMNIDEILTTKTTPKYYKS